MPGGGKYNTPKQQQQHKAKQKHNAREEPSNNTKEGEVSSSMSKHQHKTSKISLKTSSATCGKCLVHTPCNFHWTHGNEEYGLSKFWSNPSSGSPRVLNYASSQIPLRREFSTDVLHGSLLRHPAFRSTHTSLPWSGLNHHVDHLICCRRNY